VTDGAVITSASGSECDQQCKRHETTHIDDVRTGAHRDVTHTQYLVVAAAGDDDDDNDDVNSQLPGNGAA